MRPIVYSKDLEIADDHLNIRWLHDSLLVPEELGALLNSLGVRSAEQFASMLVVHPSSLAAVGVATGNILAVRDEALEELGQQLDKKFLEAPSFRPKTGARKPFKADAKL